MILVSVASLRLNASPAMTASNKTQLTGFQSSDMGLLQAIADNFDANINSPNGLKSTHALALMMTQVCQNTEGQEDTKIKRVKKENVKYSTPPGILVSYYYHGLKESEMPEEVSKTCVLPLKVLAQQIILVQRSKFHHFDFLRSVATKP